uniref:F-box domain-containing protein n=1 Tax=Mycena chlorophos TaxID=658473 RepID=A0ABQ0LMD6_MYCCL|nr:predicted protein [Mycena chlorophos]
MATPAQESTTGGILSLPDEILVYTFAPAAPRDLSSVIRSCRRLRRICMLPYLSHFGVTAQDIQDGTLRVQDLNSLSESLIITFGHITKMRRLVYSHGLSDASDGFSLFLGLPTPYGTGAAQDRLNETLIVVSSTNCIVSRPTFLSLRPSPLSFPPSPFGSLLDMLGNRAPLQMSPVKRVITGTLCLLIGPLLSIYIILLLLWLIASIYDAGKWIYLTLFRGPWTFKDRAWRAVESAHSAGSGKQGMWFWRGWMRVQFLEEGLTLVTLVEQLEVPVEAHPSPRRFHATFGGGLTNKLGHKRLGRVFRALDFGNDLHYLEVCPGTPLAYQDLIDFLARHPALDELGLGSQRESILSSTLPSIPDPNSEFPAIKYLFAPIAYLALLIPNTPNLTDVGIRSLVKPGSRRTFDHNAYQAAMEAVAALPGTHAIRLTIRLRSSLFTFPWTATRILRLKAAAAARDVESATDTSPVETRLHRITRIIFDAELGRNFLGAHFYHHRQAFARWVALFPELKELKISGLGDDVIGIRPAQREEVKKVIRARCPALDVQW